MAAQRIPKNTVHVRVMAESDLAEDVAEKLGKALEASGLQLVETSEPYPCRAPQESKSRVYMTLVIRGEGDGHERY